MAEAFDPSKNDKIKKTAPMQDIVWFSDVDKDDVGLVGGKGANLGELYKIKIPVPNGFIVTSQAYFNCIKASGILDRIRSLLYNLDVENPTQLESKAKACQDLIKQIKLGKDLQEKLYSFYKKLYGTQDVYVAARSSATAEDLPQASFAGQ